VRFERANGRVEGRKLVSGLHSVCFGHELRGLRFELENLRRVDAPFLHELRRESLHLGLHRKLLRLELHLLDLHTRVGSGGVLSGPG